MNNLQLAGMPEPLPLQIVAFAGRAGAGKTTAATILEQRGFRRTSFAAPIKAALNAMFPHWGPMHWTTKKEDVDPLAGFSPRVAAQKLGTDWGRELNPDLWVNLLRAQITQSRCRRWVIDDVRFLNEVLAVQALGGRVLVVASTDAPGGQEEALAYSGKFAKPTSPEVAQHESEALQGVWEASDGTLHNDGTPEGLVRMLDHCLENLGVVP